jgi:CubicO group peptidase (beta-lactamase class C family)/pimeloyl-ACP methyl ester carboxylesterase
MTAFFISLFLACLACSAQIDVPHRTETITFRSGDFKVVGELRVPQNNTVHPLVIMVHGDGPAYRTHFAKLKEAMLRAGYATLMWDKPGYGESTGKLSQEKRLAERASILADAVNVMKKHAAIDPGRIGLWGISQAGYVMPLALRQTDDIQFMIAVGCPGMNGIDQTAYLIRRQLTFEGMPEEKARQAETHFKQLYAARTFQEYLSHAKPLYDNPVQRKLGFVSALWEEGDWKPRSPDEESFFDPIEIIETTTIPVLAFFGEKDTQVDPFQGAEAYEKALARAGNQDYRVELIPDADHNIILSETGSMGERNRRSRKEWQNYAPEYLEIMEKWLKERGPGPTARTGTDRDGYQDILGCWEGKPAGKFSERNKQLRLISLKPDGSPAITLIYDLTPRSHIWDHDLDVTYQDGAVSWEAHKGHLSDDKKTMTVVKEWKGERSTWSFTRRKGSDALMHQLKSSTGKEYAYEVPESLDDGWTCGDVSNAGIDKEIIVPFMRRIAQGKHDDIHSILIAKDGKLVLEEYFATNGKRYGSLIKQVFRDRPHHLASTTKSVLSALCGIAVDHGLLKDTEEPIYRYLPAYAASFSDEKKAITVKDMLTMTPGWEWEQFKYPWDDPRNNGGEMYNREDVIKYVLERPLAAKPGAKFNYSNGVPTVMGAVLKNACGMDVDRYAGQNLFHPLGISDYPWTRYFDGSLETDGGLALRSRDLAKIGQLFLNNGDWQGKNVISGKWVRESTEQRIDLNGIWGWGYGYYWMQVDLKTRGGTVRSYFVPGDGGQLLAVFPDLNMVIVFTAGNYGRDVKSVCFSMISRYILPAVMSSIQ